MADNSKYRPATSERVFFSWAFLNVPFLALLAAGLVTGYIQPYIHDVTGLTYIIMGIVVSTVLYAGRIASRIRYDFSRWRRIRSEFGHSEDALFLHIDSRLDTLRYIATAVLALGFLGTVIGVIIGLQSFPADAYTDVAAMQKFIQQMLVGFSTELHTLVAGLIGNIWLNFNIHIFERYDTKLYAKIIDQS